jgi:hypothetical protein
VGRGGPLQRKIRCGRGSSGGYLNKVPGSAALFSWGLGQLVFLGLRPPPPQRDPLSDGQAALQRLADSGVLGKLVLELYKLEAHRVCLCRRLCRSREVGDNRLDRVLEDAEFETGCERAQPDVSRNRSAESINQPTNGITVDHLLYAA